MASEPPPFEYTKEAWASVDNQRDFALLGMVNWVANQNTFFDLRANYFLSKWPIHIQPDADPFSPTFIDLYTGVLSGTWFFNQDTDQKGSKSQPVEPTS